MNFKQVVFQLIATTFLFGGSSTLIEKAKKNGLAPIPNDKKELLKIIDPEKVITTERVKLGKMLYFDPRLSKSSLISCNWCHNLGLGGVDGVSKAIGHMWRGNPMHLNSPTVYNAVFAKRQFWDGRSPNLEEQAEGPIQAGVEMAAPKKLIEDRINSIPEYVKLFHDAYKTKKRVSFKQIAKTIAIFERTLVTPSRYDDFLNGKKDALTKKEQEGLELFIDKGCVTCHNGIALGGDLKPFELKSQYKYRDTGGFIGKYKKIIKVPTLRNITETAPYFHNGMIWNLKDAIKEMGKVQVGYKIKQTQKGKAFSVDIMPISLTNKDIDKIYTFFQTLKGEKPKIEYPQLPPSTLKTARPDEK